MYSVPSPRNTRISVKNACLQALRIFQVRPSYTSTTLFVPKLEGCCFLGLCQNYRHFSQYNCQFGELSSGALQLLPFLFSLLNSSCLKNAVISCTPSEFFFFFFLLCTMLHLGNELCGYRKFFLSRGYYLKQLQKTHLLNIC